MSQLKIVWRNPKTTRRPRRWHELAYDVGRKLYVVEELVPQGEHKRWAQAAALEVVQGSRAYRSGIRSNSPWPASRTS